MTNTLAADSEAPTYLGKYSCVLWDVDGTLVDASEGILNRLTTVLSGYGLPVPTRQNLGAWIGPPMAESFQTQAGMSPEQADEALAVYRRVGKAYGYTRDTRLYPGVAELVAELNRLGVAQSTASSKPRTQVVALMDHYGLSPLLRVIVGASADEKTLAAKADIVAEALRSLAARGVDTSRPVLIGDRHHDVAGGTAHGVPVIFVRWGFSEPNEAAGAVAVANTVDELRQLLLQPEGAQRSDEARR